MHPSRPLGLLLALSLSALGGDPFAEFIRPTAKLSPAEAHGTFALPPGFEIQLVAAEPDIAKPISMAFDAAGRLWVAETRFYPVESAVDKTPRDTIRILSDFDEAGRARKIEVFAGGLNTPDAVAPYKDGAIVFSIPNVLSLRDSDGNGTAETGATLYGPFETRDTHNMANNFRRGFDGWFYGGHGVANQTTVQGQDGHKITMNGATFRFRGDGSRIELFGSGLVNPFGICFDPLGNVFASDCHSSPIYQLMRGAFYPSFGKPDDGLGFAPTMMRHSHNSTAIAGLCLYDDVLWPAEFRGNMFLGNVMTSRVNRDRISEAGSTKIAHEMPDLVSSSDPWFRPVDVQLGPDGALYIADFYNRIIAHVEVPLDHPGRDRDSGRIWRVVHRGPDGKLALRPRRDLTVLPLPEVVGALGDPNFTTRLTALNHLADLGGKEVLAEVRRAGGNADAGAAVLWLLERLGVLEDAELAAAARDPDRLIRTHAQRVLAERESLSPAQRTLVFAALDDEDPLVCRTAADVLARHPAAENIPPLLALRQRAAVADTHLVFMSRKALRDQLLEPARFTSLASMDLSEADARTIADVGGAVPSAGAATFLLAFIQKHAVDGEVLAAHLRHIARHAPEEGLAPLATFVRERFAEDLEFQVDLFRSIQLGLEQRGVQLSSPLRQWGAHLTAQLLDPVTAQTIAWTNAPLESAGNTTNPWFVQPRVSADVSAPAPFFCSLPPGGEALTGVLRSAPFAIPATLSFWIAGHDGRPEMPSAGKNYVCLRDVESGAVLAQTPAPRNDLAQRVAWELSRHEGRRVVIEIVDGHSGDSFAWIAAGRFEPPVTKIPQRLPSSIPQRERMAAEFAGKLRLKEFESRFEEMLKNRSGDGESRLAASRTLLVLDGPRHLTQAAALLHDVALPLAGRGEIGRAIAEIGSADARLALCEAIHIAPQRLQLQLAQALSGSGEGADALLAAVAEGKISSQILTDRVISDKIVAARPGAVEQMRALTIGLQPTSERLQQLIDERRDAHPKADARIAEGAQVFTQTCAVCHSIEGQGGSLGPQLDGVGHRGLERLCEDILDPNRNVDRVFRYSLVTLKSGEIISGLFRREEGDLLVFADATGEEITVPKRAVQERSEAETSLMPEIFADALTPAEFHHLLAFLLSQNQSAPPR